MKAKLIFPFVLFFLLSFGSRAEHISHDKARNIAGKVFLEKVRPDDFRDKTEATISSEFTLQNAGVDVIYIFNFSSGGWVMLAADDRVVPVLAFSPEGEIDPSKGAPAFRWMLAGYGKQISEAINNDLDPGAAIASQWQLWLGDGHAAKDAKSQQPLLNCEWNQGKYYNKLCPEDPDGPDGRVYTGCVATCMAQVMYYYRYPLQGTGSHGYYSDYGYLFANFGTTTYNWDEMENSIGNLYNIPMALIQYHCGIAVSMNYSPSGSGAYMGSAADAMRDYFGYDPSLQLKYKDDYSDTQWKSMLISELDNKRPLCYAGFGDGGGHAFNCDGYQGTDHFHFNWGWGGYGDGYFYLDNLNPSYTFTNGQQAIFGVYPATAFPYGCNGSKTLTATRGSIEDGSGPVSDYSANNDCYWLINPDIPVATIHLTFDRFDTESGADIVTIYDGDSFTDSILASFSGSTIPPAVHSTGSKMLIRFTSNTSLNMNGWQASYRSTFPEYCQYMAELTAPSGSFGDGSEANPYNNSTQCRWRIAPPGATGITVSFISFDMEGTDFVKIYDEAANLAIATFHGNTLPNSVFIATSKVMVLFMSDNYGTAGGFEASYTSGTNSISGSDALQGLCVFPNPANDLLNIKAEIPMSESVNLRLLSPEGREILQKQMPVIGGRLDTQLDVAAIAKGLYFLYFDLSGTKQVIPVVVE